MKYLFPALLFFFFNHPAFSQDLGIPYQAIALDSIGKPIKNQNIQIRISISDSCSTCTTIFQEIHSSITDKNGMFNLIIGQSSSNSQISFSNIPWANSKNKWLKMEIWRNQSFQLIGNQQLFYTPFSIYSKKAEEVNKLPRSTQNYIFSDGW